MELDRIASYEILDTIGSGGMGTVFLARDETLDRTLAVKVIHPAQLGARGKERFLREARACSSINHRNIVTVYAAGEDKGLLYLAMELLKGKTVRQMISEGPVPWRRTIEHAVELLDALEKLHGAGLIHRDLKPENVIVTDEGIPKLMDFGIVRVTTSETITVEGGTIGTISYMSPEQTIGNRIDARSDLFSLGIVLYEMLTGRHPFPGEHPMAVMYSITNEPYLPIDRETIGGFPAGLDAAIDRALKKNPNERFAGAAEFKRELETILQRERPPLSGEGSGLKRSLMRILIPAASAAIVLGALTLVFERRAADGDRALAKHHNELGQGFEKLGKIDLANVEYRNAIIADQRWEVPWNNLAALAISGGNWREADSLLLRALSVNDRYTIALFNLAGVRWAMRDVAGAERYFRAAIESDSLLVEGYNNLGALLLDAGRPEEALNVLELGLLRAEREKNSDPGARGHILKHLGRAERMIHREDLALPFLERALEILPNDAELHRCLAELYEGSGMIPEARRHWLALAKLGSLEDRGAAAAALERIDGR